MRRPQTAKVVTLHSTGKTLTLGDTDNINLLAADKVISTQSCAHFNNRVIRNTELSNFRLRGYASLFKLTTLGFRNIFDFTTANANLKRCIAIFIFITNGSDLAVFHLKNSHRYV